MLEKIIDYTDCNGCQKVINGKQTLDQSCNCTVQFTLDKKFDGKVYLYYGLSNFYQVCYLQAAFHIVNSL